jgi:type IV secretory pathway VirB10-like protein
MRNIVLAVITLLVIAAVIFCGGDKEAETQQQATEQVQNQEHAQADQPQNRSELHDPNKRDMTMKNPNADQNPVPPEEIVPMGTEVPPEDLQEGTCEYTAYWFAEYFTSGDSTKAYELCTDSMKNIVRQILQTPGQMRNMKLNRSAGYTLEGVALANESSGDNCRACLRATFMNEEKQDCNFNFTKINGKWLLSAFRKN